MVVRLTITLSNNKHPKFLDEMSEAMANQVLEKQYQEAFNLLTSLSDDPSEKAVVEKCELVSSGTEK